MTVAENDFNVSELMPGFRFLHAYTECTDQIQEGIRELLAIVFDKEADSDDRVMAMHTLADALYPNPHEGSLGMDLEQSEAMGAQHSSETRDVLAQMDEEESNFAAKLSAIMKDRNLTQVELADISGVGQPAISNMLKRQCRPQRRTIERFATALDIAPEELWPAFTSDVE